MQRVDRLADESHRDQKEDSEQQHAGTRLDQRLRDESQKPREGLRTDDIVYDQLQRYRDQQRERCCGEIDQHQKRNMRPVRTGDSQETGDERHVSRNEATS